MSMDTLRKWVWISINYSCLLMNNENYIDDCLHIQLIVTEMMSYEIHINMCVINMMMILFTNISVYMDIWSVSDISKGKTETDHNQNDIFHCTTIKLAILHGTECWVVKGQ